MKQGLAPDTEPLAAVRSGIPRWIEAPVALLAIVVASPLLLISAAAVALSSRGPVVFRQSRVGQAGRFFVLYKFRTMRRAGEGPQVTARDDPRVTGVGRLLRKTKVDELPQLWNVVKGDMSLVGPRPEVPVYVDLGNPLWHYVLAARPGLTDPVTLFLRNEEELLARMPGDRETFYLETLQPYKLQGYVAYLRERNWRQDVRILFRTPLAIIYPKVIRPWPLTARANKPKHESGPAPRIDNFPA